MYTVVLNFWQLDWGP